MSTPVNPGVVEPRKVTFFAVAAPGVDPASITIEPSVRIVGWKFGEMDKGELIDVIAEADKQLKALDKWVEAARVALKAALVVPEVAGTQTVMEGKLFQAEYKRTDRVALDQEALKRDYATDTGWLQKYTKTTPVLTLRIVPIPQTPAAT